jgi:hypothetical protein
MAVAMGKAAEVDPIFALIEKHKAACDASRAFSACWADMSPSDPEYNVVEGRFDDAYKGEREVLVALLTRQPTTIAGVIAVLEHVGQTDWVFGNDSEDTVLTDSCERNIEEAKAFPAHVAIALRQIIGHRRGDEAMTTTAKRRPGAAKPDPISAAILAHKAAFKKWLATNDLLEKKKDAAAKKIGQRPTELIVWRDYYIGDSEIPHRRKDFSGRRWRARSSSRPNISTPWNAIVSSAEERRSGTNGSVSPNYGSNWPRPLPRNMILAKASRS